MPRNRHSATPKFMSSPVVDATAITPSDSQDLAETTMSLYVTTPGSLTVTLFGGSTVTYPNIAAGRHPLCISRVFATGTTATGLIAEY